MEFELYSHFYYRGDDYIPRRITIVGKYERPGFYWVVNGHLTKEEIEVKKPERFLIHVNKITT